MSVRRGSTASRRSALLGVCALAACQGLVSDVDLERMIEQRSFRVYEAAPFFDDGRAMRPPPLGTVPRGRPLGESALSAAVVAGRFVGRIPVPVTMELLGRGRDRFEIFCAVCHGVLGTGESSVARNMTLRKPPSLHEDRIAALPPGQVFQTISVGYGLMPAYDRELSAADRWAVVAYLDALRFSQRVRLAELPTTIRAEAGRSLR